MPISEQWAELLEPGIRQIFQIQYEALAAMSVIPQLFRVMNSAKSEEHFLDMGGFGDWNEYEGRIDYDRMEQGYKTTLTPKEYADGFKIERTLIDDDLYNQINARPQGLALAAQRTREKHAASVFNNAFSSSYTGGDGIELCGDHPYSPQNSTTQSNESTTALSYDAIVSAREAMRAYVDDRGELVPARPDVLLVPPELEETANSIVKTMNKVDTGDYHANFVSSKVSTVIVWDYLTDANNWFLIDSQLAKQQLLWIDRVAIEFAMDPVSEYDLEARFRGYMRYAYGWAGWRWVYGQEV